MMMTMVVLVVLIMMSDEGIMQSYVNTTAHTW